MNPSTKMKRRAAVGAVLALLGFTGCLVAALMADRMKEMALRPRINLLPVMQVLRQVNDLGPNGPNLPAGGYQQALQEAIANRSDILAAAVVSDGGTILAAYPEDQNLLGHSLTAPPPGRRFPVPGITAEQPTADGWYLYLRPGDQANDGPIDPPWQPSGAHRPLNLDDPQIEAHFRDLMHMGKGTNSPALQGHLITTSIPGSPVGAASALLVLPRPYRAAYELAAYYLRPAFITGSLVSLLLFWLMLPWWVYLDARPRTDKAIPLSMFVLLTNFFGWLTYLVIRPEAERLCPVCVELMEPSYRCCPHCGWTSQARCHQCGRPARSDWRFCPYCETPQADVARGEPALAGIPAQPPPH